MLAPQRIKKPEMWKVTLQHLIIKATAEKPHTEKSMPWQYLNHAWAFRLLETQSTWKLNKTDTDPQEKWNLVKYNWY